MSHAKSTNKISVNVQIDTNPSFSYQRKSARLEFEKQALHEVMAAFAAITADVRRTTLVESLPIPDHDDLGGQLRLGVEATAFYRDYIRESYSAEPGVAVRDEDELNPGKDKVVFRSQSGDTKTYRNLPDPDRTSLYETSVAVPVADDPWAVFSNVDAPVVSRIAAMSEMRDTRFMVDVADYVTDQLGSTQVPASWRDALVFAAEDHNFPIEKRESVGEALWNLALTLRIDPSGPENVVWSALRRGASLLSMSCVERLLVFLAPGGTVDTRAVALQCIVRMHEVVPPFKNPNIIANRVYRFAECFLDPDVFTPGEPSLIARNAVVALAAIGDERLSESLSRSC